MNVFEAIYNIETSFMLIIMISVLFLTLYVGRGVSTEKQAFTLATIVFVEIIIIIALYLLLTKLGSKAKSIFGIFDLLSFRM